MLNSALCRLPHTDAPAGLASFRESHLQLAAAHGALLPDKLRLSLSDVAMRRRPEDLPCALRELRKLHCYKLVHQLSRPTLQLAANTDQNRDGDVPLSVQLPPGWTSSDWSSVIDLSAEASLRLGTWAECSSEASGTQPAKHVGCYPLAAQLGDAYQHHVALLRAIDLLGSKEPGAFATLKRTIGAAQCAIVNQLRQTHPEHSALISKLLGVLQLCGLLREASGALASDLLPTAHATALCVPDFLMVSNACHSRSTAAKSGSTRDGTQDSVGGSQCHTSLPNSCGLPDVEAQSTWSAWRKNRQQQQLTLLERRNFSLSEPIISMHIGMLRHMSPDSHDELLEIMVDAGRRARRDGKLDVAVHARDTKCPIIILPHD